MAVSRICMAGHGTLHNHLKTQFRMYKAANAWLVLLLDVLVSHQVQSVYMV